MREECHMFTDNTKRDCRHQKKGENVIFRESYKMNRHRDLLSHPSEQCNTVQVNAFFLRLNLTLKWPRCPIAFYYWGYHVYMIHMHNT